MKYPHIHVKLTGTDGNAYALIGKVASAIRSVEGAAAAKEFTKEAMESPSYEKLLVFLQATVDVQ